MLAIVTVTAVTVTEVLCISHAVTQLDFRYLAEDVDTGKAYVACTQPRKIAAVGLAQFVGSHLDQGSNSQAISGIDILSIWTISH